MQTDKIIIRAGGGLVCDEQGRFLMIFRRGHWDLPKGKFEDGETIELCALREVEEECGIKPTLGRKLCITTHFYTLDGQSIEKQTTWFAMNAPSSSLLVPQTEEDIERCEWVASSDIERRLTDSYSTISEVFKAFND